LENKVYKVKKVNREFKEFRVYKEFRVFLELHQCSNQKTIIDMYRMIMVKLEHKWVNPKVIKV
jgi:hypothetical protein